MLPKTEKQEEQNNTSLSMGINPSEAIDLDDDMDCMMGGEIDAIDKVLTTTKTKPKMVRKNIEHYLEERALKRRVRDVFEDELLLVD